MAGTRSLGALTLDLVARVGGFTSGLSQAEREAQRRVRGIQNTFRGLGRVISGAFAAIGGAALVRGIVRATSEAEAAFANLRNAVQQNGGAVGRTTEQLAGMAGELQKVSTFGDEAIMTAQGLLLRFQSIQGVNFDRALQSTLDLATALGTDLPNAAKLIGRALEDPRKGLTQLERAGVVLEKSQADLVKRLVETGRQTEAQQILLSELEQRYSGAAKAARDTFGGALTAVQNAFGDLLEAKGGVSDATRALNDFADLLQDPDTVAAANTLASAIVTAFSAATRAITGTVEVVRFLGEEFAALRHGAAADDIARLTEELEKFEELRASKVSEIFSWTGSEFLNRLRFFGKDGLVEWYSDEDLDREIERLKRQLEEATSGFRPVVPTATGGGTGGPVLPLPPSEEFLKLEERLKQQIALFGQVGEAAKIAYQIQSGQLDDMSESEQKRILSLARQYDLLVQNAAAEKELEAARKQLDSALKSQIANYEQQIALTGEVTELERIRYEISKGGLQGITADQAAYLETLAKEIDLEKQRADLQRRVNSLIESTQTPLERYNKTIEELNKLREESIALLGEEGLSYETYSRAVAQAQKELDAATNQWTIFKEQAARNTQDIIADTLVNGFEDGTKGILKAFGEMIKQLVAQAVAADIAGKLFGTAAGGQGDGWIGTALGFLGGFFGGGRAAGGDVSAGVMYRVNEIEDEYFRPNASGKIIPLSKMGPAGTQTNNFSINISAPNGAVSMQTRQQIMADVARGVALANRRNN